MAKAGGVGMRYLQAKREMGMQPFPHPVGEQWRHSLALLNGRKIHFCYLIYVVCDSCFQWENRTSVWPNFQEGWLRDAEGVDFVRDS